MATMTPFQKAFNEAKRAGRKTFSFNGEPYSTKTAEEQGREIGAKAAAGSGRGMAAGRTASDKDTSSGRAEIPKGTGGAKAPAASTERRMSPLEMGLLTTSGALAAPLAVRGVMKTAPKVAGMASKAGEAVKGAASKAGEAVKGAASKASEAAKGAASKASEAAKGAASKAGEAVKGAMERRAAAKVAPERKEPSMYPEPPKTGGVFRSAREPAPPKPRVKVEGTKGGVYRSETPKASSETTSFRSRTADRADERMADFKKGGMTKAYAKGGMTKAGGCETRGKKARYV
jgi:hypothetical protein